MERIPDVSERVAERVLGDWSEEESAGRVTLRRRRKRAAVLRWFGVPPEVVIHLDDVGSAAWRLLDGRRVADVRAALHARFPDLGDVSARLGRFLGVMVSHGLVRLS